MTMEFDPSMTPKQFLGSMKEETNKLHKDLSDTWEDTAKELLETMRGLALISGAIATGALVLLGTGVLIEQTLVLIGVITLLLETVLIFGYLLQTHTSGIDEIEEGLY